MGVARNCGYPFGAPHNEDYGILRSMLGFPYFGKLPYIAGAVHKEAQP